MEEQERRYALVIKKKRIEVSEEVYRTYYKLTEREKYLDKLAVQNNLSFEECEEKGIPIDYILSQIQESVEDKLIYEEMLSKLYAAVERLTEQERLLIYELFFLGKSERDVCAALEIAKTTLHDRKKKILCKLKKLLET